MGGGGGGGGGKGVGFGAGGVGGGGGGGGCGGGAFFLTHGKLHLGLSQGVSDLPGHAGVQPESHVSLTGLQPFDCSNAVVGRLWQLIPLHSLHCQCDSFGGVVPQPAQSIAPTFELTPVPEAVPLGPKYEEDIQNLVPCGLGGEHQSLHEPFVTFLASDPPPVAHVGAKHSEGQSPSLTGFFCNTKYTIRLINTIAKVQFNNIIYISHIY